MLPKEIMVAEYSPDRKLAHLVITLNNVPGALNRCTGLIAAEGVNVLSGFHVAPTARQYGYWSFFADLTNAKSTLGQLASKLKSLEAVTNVTSSESKDGLLIDTSHFPVTYSTFTVFLLRVDVFSQMLQRIYSMIGAPAGVVFYQMGFIGGSTTFNGLKRTIGRDMVRRNATYLLSMFSALGWGIFELVDLSFERRRATVRSRSNIECKQSAGKATEPQSNFVRGHLSGVFSEIFEERMDSVEVRCEALGDEFCEFNIFPAAG